MAAIKACSSNILISSGNAFAILDFRSQNSVKVIKIPSIDDVGADFDAKKDSNSFSDGNRILASAFSKSGKYFALADDRKYLHLYASEECRLLSSRCVVRRCTGVVFSQDEKTMVISDKSGDVYRFLVEDTNKDGELLLGHLSMLLDLNLIKNDKYLATCDKDEKIRISCYPNSHNIHSYCLGHTQFVTSLIYDEEDDLLMSASGDCTIRIWSFDGEEIYCQKCQCISSNATESDTDLPYIKQLTFQPKHKMLAVCVGRSLNIEIYRLKLTNNIPSLEFIQCLRVAMEAWDIVFDGNNRLYILQPVESSHLLVYNIIGDDEPEKLETCTNDEVIGPVSKLNEQKDFFSASLQVESIYPNLRKVRIDNMTEYLQRKERRIQGEKLDPPTYNEKKPKIS